MHKSKSRPSIVLSAILVSVLICALMLEVVARLVFVFHDELSSNILVSELARGRLVLNSYEVESSRIGGHWTLRPGFSSPDHSYRINAHGMRGPEIDESHSRVRLLTLGDSVTFGIGGISYPRHIERALKERGHEVEVINGGVEGYSTKNLLIEIDQYLELRPDIVTILIGWNNLFSPALWLKRHENACRACWLVRNVTRNIYRRFAGEREYALEMRFRHPQPDQQSADVLYAKTYDPPFLDDIKELVSRFKGAGARVYLLSLAGLFSVNDFPSARALEIGHLPPFTKNPFVLAEITERYNADLEELSSKLDVGFIDLATWAHENLRPSEDYFSDSVHLTREGFRRVGQEIGDRLIKDLTEKPLH